ncbi:potassium channel family protein [Ruegeria sp. Ofav3-42]|uniref:potassium channel family protein n=1 Tax=Ruegeria sp. Ofav3-42 TaxID=2917759 RepID=UPI001EF42F2C|nr:potassium channel family protein [Ruegeria sp. Ofav3-42]MCG7521957.1 potassium channel family protein [Ruegeria sp. Ofav3-42]
MIGFLNKFRLELYFASQLLILFGSMVSGELFFEKWMGDALFLINIAMGISLLKERSFLLRIILVLLAASVGIDLFDYWMGISVWSSTAVNQFQILLFLAIYGIVAMRIAEIEWRATVINQSVIIGLVAGYLSLGFVSFFLFLTIEYFAPGSLHGIDVNHGLEAETQSILYFSFITLMTIGYGDFIPVTHVAQKASVLVGLMGQFYMVFLTAIVVGKYLQQPKEP